jgi:hypothetical protein
MVSAIPLYWAPWNEARTTLPGIYDVDLGPCQLLTIAALAVPQSVNVIWYRRRPLPSTSRADINVSPNTIV